MKFMEIPAQKARVRTTRSVRLGARTPRAPSPEPRAPKHERITERQNPVSADLDAKSTLEVLRIINREDRKVAPAVAKVIPQIARAAELAIKACAEGGRLVYLGAGTSGRLGVLDAAECIPTFGTDSVIGVMAGAPEAMFRPTEASDRKSTRLNSSHSSISYAVFCLKKKRSTKKHNNRENKTQNKKHKN